MPRRRGGGCDAVIPCPSARGAVKGMRSGGGAFGEGSATGGRCAEGRWQTYELHETADGTAFIYRGELGTDVWRLEQWWADCVADAWQHAVTHSLDRIQTEAERRAHLRPVGSHNAETSLMSFSSTVNRATHARAPTLTTTKQDGTAAMV